jgi:hypothetical protein
MNIIPIYKTKAEASALAGSITKTSKMPCGSYSLPTSACKTGAKLAKVKGSICSSCYANRGLYKVFSKNILPAQDKRLQSIESPEWVPAMVKLIGTKNDYFRWHDSGDIQSVGHLHKIAQIAMALPSVMFWIPTREYRIVKKYLSIYNYFPSNLTVRLSALFPDKPVRSFEGLTTSNVHKVKDAVGTACPAPENNGECGSCRKCWNANEKTVSYKYH